MVFFFITSIVLFCIWFYLGLEHLYPVGKAAKHFLPCLLEIVLCPCQEPIIPKLEVTIQRNKFYSIPLFQPAIHLHVIFFITGQSLNWKKKEKKLILMYPRVSQICREIVLFFFSSRVRHQKWWCLHSSIFGILIPGRKHSTLLWRWSTHGPSKEKHP